MPLDPKTVISTLDAISSQAHALSKSSNPAAKEPSKAEQVASLVERLSDTLKTLVAEPEAEPESGRPPLPRADSAPTPP